MMYYNKVQFYLKQIDTSNSMWMSLSMKSFYFSTKKTAEQAIFQTCKFISLLHIRRTLLFHNTWCSIFQQQTTCILSLSSAHRFCSPVNLLTRSIIMLTLFNFIYYCRTIRSTGSCIKHRRLTSFSLLKLYIQYTMYVFILMYVTISSFMTFLFSPIYFSTINLPF